MSEYVHTTTVRRDPTAGKVITQNYKGLQSVAARAVARSFVLNHHPLADEEGENEKAMVNEDVEWIVNRLTDYRALRDLTFSAGLRLSVGWDSNGLGACSLQNNIDGRFGGEIFGMFVGGDTVFWWSTPAYHESDPF